MVFIVVVYGPITIYNLFSIIYLFWGSTDEIKQIKLLHCVTSSDIFKNLYYEIYETIMPTYYIESKIGF